jgi:hypothetical protein
MIETNFSQRADLMYISYAYLCPNRSEEFRI